MKKNKYGRPKFVRGSCSSGKIQFSQKWAEKEAHRASMRERENIHAYRCPECLKWHIGHWDKKKWTRR